MNAEHDNSNSGGHINKEAELLEALWEAEQGSLPPASVSSKTKQALADILRKHGITEAPAIDALQVYDEPPPAQQPQAFLEAADLVTDACKVAMSALFGAEPATWRSLDELQQKANGLLSRLLGISLLKPAMPGGTAGSSAMSDAPQTGAQPPVFTLDWAQDDANWRMQGWKGGKVTLERIEGSGRDPSSIAWSATGGEAEHYPLSREGDHLLVGISAAKAMRRAERIERARGDMDRVAVLLPVAYWRKESDAKPS